MLCSTNLSFALLLLFIQPIHSQCSEGSKPCGYYGQICCAPGQWCATDNNNEAICVSGPVSSPPSSSVSCSAFCGIWGQVMETVIWSTVRSYSTFSATGCYAMLSTTTTSTVLFTSPAHQTSTLPSTSIPATTSAQLLVCPTGWYFCPATQGGGCCPIGYDCAIDNQCIRPTVSSSTLNQNSTSFTTSTTSISCNYSLNESPCGNVCCTSGQYCYDYAAGVCSVAGSPPLRPTSSSNTVTPQSTSSK
jgi:hypothetical protein